MERPVKGKTYSLFGIQGSAAGFFGEVSSLTDRILDRWGLSEKELLQYIQAISVHRRKLRRTASWKNEMWQPAHRSAVVSPLILDAGTDTRLSDLLSLLHEVLRKYSADMEAHLRGAPFYKAITDRGLLTTREQYYLYMVEFELVNRIHIEGFRRANYRIALLPYCLRETQTHCQAISDQVDFRCAGCRKACYIHRVSELLRANNVAPYIWRTAKLKPLFRDLATKRGTFGVLGIACIVELSAGMRRCMNAKLPVVGIPLNANRCSRWMDQFQDTSVNLGALEKLVSG